MSKDVQKQVEETLNSLDGMQRAEANPFLYSKIKSRLQSAKEIVPQQLAWRMIAALVVVALLNVFTLRHFSEKTESDNRGVESVANEYSITLPQSY